MVVDHLKKIFTFTSRPEETLAVLHKAPFFDRFEWQVRDSFDLNDIPGSGYLIIFEQPNSSLMFVPVPFCWSDAGIFQTQQNRLLVISQLLPISSFPRMDAWSWQAMAAVSTLSEKSKVYSLWRAAAHTTLMWCDFGPHKSGPFSALGNTFVFRQSGERVVISHWHADSRVVLWQSKGIIPPRRVVISHWHADPRVVLLQSKGRNPTFQGRNLSLTCRFQGRTFAV